MHRRKSTFGPGVAVTLLPEKNYTMPESVTVVQTHSTISRNKNVHNSHV